MADLPDKPLDTPIPYPAVPAAGGPLGVLGDVAIGAGAGVLDIGGGAAALGANITGNDNLRRIAEMTNYAADLVRQQMSDKSKQRMEASWVGETGKPSAWRDPLGTLAVQASGVAAPIAATIASPPAAPVIWGATTLGQLHGETAREVDSASDADLRAKYPDYAAARAAGTDERRARSELQQTLAGVVPSAIAAGTGALSGWPISRALTPAAAPLLRRAGTGAFEGAAAGVVGGSGFDIAKQQGEIAARGRSGFDLEQAAVAGANLAAMGVGPGAIAAAVSRQRPKGGTKTVVPPEIDVALTDELPGGVERVVPRRPVRGAPLESYFDTPRGGSRRPGTSLHEPTSATWKFLNNPWEPTVDVMAPEGPVYRSRTAAERRAGLAEWGIGDATLGAEAQPRRGRLPKGKVWPPDGGGGTPPPDDTGPPDGGGVRGVPPTTPPADTPPAGSAATPEALPPLDPLPPVPTQGAASSLASATGVGPAVYTHPATGAHEQVIVVPERDRTTGYLTEPRSEGSEVVRTILIEDANGRPVEQTVRARDLEMVPDFVLVEMERDSGVLDRWLANRPADNTRITPAEPPTWTPPPVNRPSVMGRSARQGYEQLAEIAPTERYTQVTTEQRPTRGGSHVEIIENMVPYEGARPRDVPVDIYDQPQGHDPGGVRTEMVRQPDGSYRAEPDRRQWYAENAATIQRRTGGEEPPNFSQQVAARLREEAAVPKGHVRLYRIQENRTGTAAVEPDWLRQAVAERGLDNVYGRWFTNDPKLLDWYVHEKGGPSRFTYFRYIDLPLDHLQRYRVSHITEDMARGADPRAFASQPEAEFFLPRGLVLRARSVGVEFRPDGTIAVMGVPYEGPPRVERPPPRVGGGGAMQVGAGPLVSDTTPRGRVTDKLRELAARRAERLPGEWQRPPEMTAAVRMDPRSGRPARTPAPVQRRPGPYEGSGWIETKTRPPTEREVAAGARPDRPITETRDLGKIVEHESKVAKAAEKKAYKAERQEEGKAYRDINMGQVNLKLGRLFRTLRDLAIFQPRNWEALSPLPQKLARIKRPRLPKGTPEAERARARAQYEADRKAAAELRHEERPLAGARSVLARDQILAEAETVVKRMQEALGDDFAAVDAAKWRRTRAEQAKGDTYITDYPRRHIARLIWRLHSARAGVERRLRDESVITSRMTADEVRSAVAGDARMDSAFRAFREDYDKLKQQRGVEAELDTRTAEERLIDELKAPPPPEPLPSEQRAGELTTRISELERTLKENQDQLAAARRKLDAERASTPQRTQAIGVASRRVTKLAEEAEAIRREIRKLEAERGPLQETVVEEAAERDAAPKTKYEVALDKSIADAEAAVKLAENDLAAKERRLANLRAQPRTGARRPDITAAIAARDASARTLIERTDKLDKLRSERAEAAEETRASEEAASGKVSPEWLEAEAAAEKPMSARERAEEESGGRTDEEAAESEDAGWVAVEGGFSDPELVRRYGDNGDAPVTSTADVELTRALEDIGANRDQPTANLLRTIVDKFKALVGDTPIRFLDMGDFMTSTNGRRAAGRFSYDERGTLRGGDRGVISIPRETMQGPYGITTVLHEVAHAATVHAIRANPEIARDLGALGRTVKWYAGEYPELLTRHNLTLRDLKDLDTLDKPRETIAVALSNEGLQRMMIEIPASTRIRSKYGLSKNASLWDGMINAIARLFRLDRAEYSVLDAILSINDEIAQYTPPPAPRRNTRITAIDRPEVREALEEAKTAIRHNAGNVLQRARLGIASTRSVVRSLNRYLPMADADKGLTHADLWMQAVQRMAHENDNIITSEFQPAANEARQLFAKYGAGEWWQKAVDYFADENRLNVYGRRSLADQTQLPTVKGQPKPDNTGRHLSADPDNPRDVQRRANWEELNDRYKELRGPNGERADLVGFFERVHDKIYPEDHNAMARENVRNLIEVVEPGVHTDAAAYGLAERIINNELTDAERAKYKGSLLKNAIDDARALRTIKGPWGPMMRFGDHVVQGRYTLDLPSGAKRYDGKGNVTEDGQYIRFDTPEERRAFDIKYRDHKTTQHKTVYIDNATGERLPVTKAQGEQLAAEGKATRKYQLRIEDRLIEFHETKADAMASFAEWQRQIDAGHNLELFGVEPRQFTLEDIGRSYLDQPYQRALKEMERSPGWEAMSEKERATLKHAMIEIGLRALGSTRVQSKRIKRQNVAGASNDFLKTFGKFVVSSAGYRAHLRYMRDINRHLKVLRDFARDKKDQTSEMTYPRRQLINELEKRSDVRDLHSRTGLDAAAANVVQRLLQVTNAYRLGLSPAYHITNLLEPEMAAMPILGTKFGNGRAYQAMRNAERALGMRDTLMQGLRQTKQAFRGARGADFNQPIIERVREAVGSERADLLTEAVELGHMQRNAGIEFHQQVLPSESALGRATDWADNVARQFTMAVEAVNRAKVLLAAYDLARADGMTHEKAKQYAFATNIDSMGDFSAWNSSPLLQHTIAKPGFQFKKYGLKTYELMGHMMRDAVDQLKTPEERAQARKALMQMIGRHAVVAGMNGLPLEPIRAALIAAGFVGFDFSYEDMQNWMRTTIADFFGTDVSEIAAGGLPRYFGVDFSQRMNLDQLLTPFDPRSYKPDEFKTYLASILFGAGGDQLVNYFKGVQALGEGKYTEFAARMGPFKATHDLLVGAQNVVLEGAETPTGKKRASPPDFMDTILTAAGFQSGRMAEEADLRGHLLREKAKRADERDRITEDYVNARSQDERDSAWERAQRYNEGRIGPERITRGTLEKSRQSRAKAEREDILGVTLGGRERGLRDIERYYNVGPRQ